MMDTFAWLAMIAKIAVVVVSFLLVVPLMLWVERRGAALIQNRLGPNRVGPLGLLQSLADAIKFIFKEDVIPGQANKFYYVLAPLVSVVPAFMTFAVIPFASKIDLGGRVIEFQISDLNVGILYTFAIASLGVYGIIMAGWASNSKFSLLGSLRSSAQMISYELSMGLSIIGLVMVFSTVDLGTMVYGQGEVLATFGPLTVPKWGIFLQPLGFIIFLTATYAETNRLPFDLPEGESEIVAGYHVEYGGMKFASFMLAEYVNMLVASSLVTTLFFGGWHLLPGMGMILSALPLDGVAAEWARIGFEAISFALKVAFFMWLFVWVRWTLPRFRYDQLMDLGWKVMLPLSLVNIFLTGILIYMKVI